jgi:hypothetical protein
MRIAVLGQAERHVEALEASARFVLDRQSVERAVYLGVDGALDSIIRDWACRLVGENPTETAVWSRSVRACLHAKPADIDKYLEKERERARLRIFESLPDAETRAVEMLGGALVVMIHDKGKLDEEDMLPARVLLFGKSRTPVVKQVGQRWFLSPGSFDADGGLMILDDDDDGILLTVFDAECREQRTERLSVERATKMKVGAAGG